MLELHVIFKGRVQGVGFRWTVVDHAEKHHLIGTVKNLSNGTVEVYAHGSKEDLEAFLKSIQADPGNAHLESVRNTFKNGDGKFSGFRIID